MNHPKDGFKSDILTKYIEYSEIKYLSQYLYKEIPKKVTENILNLSCFGVDEYNLNSTNKNTFE